MEQGLPPLIEMMQVPSAQLVDAAGHFIERHGLGEIVVLVAIGAGRLQRRMGTICAMTGWLVEAKETANNGQLANFPSGSLRPLDGGLPSEARFVRCAWTYPSLFNHMRRRGASRTERMELLQD